MRHENPPPLKPTYDKPRCDFCAADPYWAYPCKTFAIAIVQHPTGELIDHVSNGAWLACPTCADLIDGIAWDDLYNRTAKMLLAAGIAPLTVTESKPMMLSAWRAFDTNRKGDKVIFG